MIVCYAQHGLGEEAFDLIDQMQELGIVPKSITFVNIFFMYAVIHLLTYIQLMIVVYSRVSWTIKS